MSAPPPAPNAAHDAERLEPAMLLARAGRLLWLSCAVVLVLVAALFSLFRLLLPLASDFQAEVQAWASKELERPVQIGALDAHWRGFGPELRLQDVRLMRPGGERVALEIGEVRVGLDLRSALLQGALHPTSLELVGIQLALRRTEDGGFYLQDESLGRGDDAPRGRDVAAAAWLLSRDRLVVRSIDLRLSGFAALGFPDDLQLSNVAAEIRNAGDRHRVLASVELPERWGRSIRLAVDANGSVLEAEGWRAKLHLKADGLRLENLAAWPALELPALTGELNAELWGELADRRLGALLGSLDAYRVELPPSAPGADGGGFGHLGGEFSWHGSPQGWALQVGKLIVSRPDHTWPPSRLGIVYRAAAAEASAALGGSASYLRLEDLVPVIGRLAAVPAEARRALETLAPRGILLDLRATAYLEEEPRYRVSADLDRLGFESSGRAPGVDGLSGRLVLGDEGGSLALDGVGMTLTVPRLFRDPLRIERAQGVASWQRRDEGWALSVPALDARLPDAVGSTALELSWSAAQGAFLDLSAAFSEGDGSKVSRYLPVGIMPPRTVAWLDRAVRGGRASGGRMVYRGRVREFPFDAGVGRFHIAFDVEDAMLDYHPEWPRLERVAGRVEFEGRQMRIVANNARVLGTRIDDARAEIPDLKRDQRLRVSGHVHLPVAEGVRFMRQSPLTAGFRDRLEPLRVGGQAELDLELDLPLRRGPRPVVRGELTLNGALIGGQYLPAAFEGTSGKLSFTESGLTARGLRGTLLGGDARIEADVRWGPGDARGGGSVRASGRAVGAELARHLGAALAERVSGATQWRAEWRLPAAPGGRSTVRVESDLEGLALDLPPPIGKEAADRRATTVEVDVSQPGRRDLRLRLEPALDTVARLRLEDTLVLERGEVRLGGGRASMPAQDGLQLVGTLAELPVDRWRQLWGGASAWDLSGGPLRRIVLELGDIQFARRALGPARLVVMREGGSWQGSVEGAAIKGLLRVPVHAARGPLVLRLDRLAIPAPAGEDSGEAGAGHDPRSLPAMEIEVEDLELRGRPLGALRVGLRRVPAGLDVEQFRLRDAGLDIRLAGDWLSVPGGVRTRIDTEIETRDLGAVLEALGYAAVISEGRAKAAAQLSWPGDPFAPDLGALNGSVELEIRRGRIVDVEPGAGRIFGLFSFQALPRRLVFDFRDFFLEGFAFDRIAGNFRIRDGQSYSDDLAINGPAATISIIGRTGLGTRDYDQLVTVVPQITSSLPLAGLVAGGPTVGAVLLFFQRMFGRKIDEGSGTRYHITGGWNAPKVERLGARASAGGTQSAAEAN